MFSSQSRTPTKQALKHKRGGIILSKPIVRLNRNKKKTWDVNTEISGKDDLMSNTPFNSLVYKRDMKIIDGGKGLGGKVLEWENFMTLCNYRMEIYHEINFDE